MSGLLAGKRLLVTGVITDQSIAFSVARLAQEQGATVVLTGYGRLSLVERIAKRLPDAGAGDRAGRHQRRAPGPRSADKVREHVDGLDGVVHSIAFGPQSALGGGFLTAPWEDVATALHVSTYSYKALAVACVPLMAPGGSHGRADLRRDPGLAGLRLDGRGQGRPGVGHPLPGPLPRRAGHPGQPGVGRPAAHDGGEVDPRLRGVRGGLGRAGPARLGPHRPGAGRAGLPAPCCRTGSRPPPARSSTSTAASTPSAPDARSA